MPEAFRTGQGRFHGRKTCGTFSSSSVLDIKQTLANNSSHLYANRSECRKSVPLASGLGATVYYHIRVDVGDSYRLPLRRCNLRPPLSLNSSSEK
jgi:hypothetical protein